MNTEDAECGGIKEVSAGRNELEEVAVQNLAMNDTLSTREEQDLVAYSDKRSRRKQKGSQVEKYQDPNEGKDDYGARETLCWLRQLGLWHERTVWLNDAMPHIEEQIRREPSVQQPLMRSRGVILAFSAKLADGQQLLNSKGIRSPVLRLEIHGTR
jgi:hypothetical protein